MAEKTDDLERQVNLTFAFISAKAYSRRFLTPSWIRRNVQGYQDISDAAFRKKLGRDLVYLKRVGVPIEQVSIDSAIYDAQHAYRLVDDAYELPELNLTAEEASVVGLAGEIGHSQELAAFSRSGWTKIAASGVNRQLGGALSITNAGDLRAISAQTMDTIMRAKRSHQRIRFSYRRTKNEEPVFRSLDVWGLVPNRDRIYLVGFDPDREEPRTFRITRVSEVTFIGAAQNPQAADVDLPALVRESLKRGKQLIDARVRVRPGKALELTSLGTQVADNEWVVKDIDRDWLIRTTASYTPEAVLLEPADAVAEVVALLKNVGRV